MQQLLLGFVCFTDWVGCISCSPLLLVIFGILLFGILLPVLEIILSSYG